jgi:hypothetical protein
VRADVVVSSIRAMAVRPRQLVLGDGRTNIEFGDDDNFVEAEEHAYMAWSAYRVRQ